MPFHRAFLLIWIIAGALPASTLAQNWGTVSGEVSERGTSTTLPGVTVLVEGTNYGTATDGSGRFTMRLPAGAYSLRFSSVGFQTRSDSVIVRRDAVTELDVRLSAATLELGEVQVEERPVVEAGVFELTPREILDIPSPFRGYQALTVLPGVATNSELSNQYSVRGGGFNENLVFINGFEVFMPFRVRQGEQEGLGLFNPEMSQGVRLYTGGFPARYGGKLSSALEIEYGPSPVQQWTASAYGSLLDGGATAGYRTSDSRFGVIASGRLAQASRFFGTQELKGDYNPRYADGQIAAHLELPYGQRLEFLGIYADHVFAMTPRTQKTYFGFVSASPDVPSDLQAVWTEYDGQQDDGSTVVFGGARLYSRFTSTFNANHAFSYFSTNERERYHIIGQTILFQVDPGSGNPQTGEGHLPLGESRHEDFAENDVDVDMLTIDGQYRWAVGGGALEAGWSGRRLEFHDTLNEYWRAQEERGPIVLGDTLVDTASLTSYQGAGYAQYTFSPLADPEKLVVTTGLRADYFDFNGEWTVSPRLTARYVATEQLSVNASLGYYHQAPTYRELRGRPEPGSGILDALNRDIRSQQSIQIVGGIDYFLPHRRLYIRSEAYYKHLSDLISYDIENVRVRYSSENDSRGYTYGIDTQIRGELVPGLESWINYSFMVARERFLPEHQGEFRDGLIARPSDQRHTFSIFVQDYVPGDDSWKLHMRALFGSGLPYTPPVERHFDGDERLGSVQVPGPRSSARFTEYMRVDMGATKVIDLFGPEHGRGPTLRLSAELLNVFDMVNTVAYTWEPVGNIWRRIPTRLTPRAFNVRARIDF